MPGSSRSAASIADELTEGLDDSLQPITEEAVAVEDASKGDAATEEDVDNKGDSSADDAGDGADDDEESDDDGYTIDSADSDSEDDDDDASDDTPQPKQEAAAVSSNLSPELQYVVDNLQPLKVRGTVPGSEDVQEFTVYDPSQLPQGFRYTDDRERDIATKAFVSMETRAEKLVNDFRNQESTKAAKAFKESEERSDWGDIASLQKSGDIPKFKLKPTDPKFDEDPAAQLIEAVLEYKDNINQKYLEQANAGAPYRHIGFEDAFLRYKKENPTTVKSEAQTKEDKDRKDFAARTRGANGSEAQSQEKAPVLRSRADIERYIDSLEF